MAALRWVLFRISNSLFGIEHRTSRNCSPETLKIIHKNTHFIKLWNTPKSMWKMYFSRKAICILFWNASNLNNFIFGSFLVLKLVTCLFSKCPILLYEKKTHVTSFKTRNQPKMKLFEFGEFQNKMHMASREKYIFHMLFWAFHDTPRS